MKRDREMNADLGLAEGLIDKKFQPFIIKSQLYY